MNKFMSLLNVALKNCGLIWVPGTVAGPLRNTLDFLYPCSNIGNDSTLDPASEMSRDSFSSHSNQPFKTSE